MKFKLFLSLATVSLLIACTPTLTLMSRETGEMGTGTAENITFGNSGALTIAFKSEKYQGTWIAVKDPGSFSYGLMNSINYSAWNIADSGYGSALLRSDKGNSMRCEFRYSTTTITAIGLCQKVGTGEIFDVQAG
jgi:hypothetical protein